MSERKAYSRIKQLFMEIHSESIRETARLIGDMNSWTRQRNMPLSDILKCTLAKKGLSAAMEIRHYFQAVDKMENTISKQGYLKQRQKLNPEVFKVLNRNYLKGFYEENEAKGWRGYLVMAIDGSRAEIPNSEENRQVYGESINKYGKAVARANISALYDVCNRFMLDIGIHNYRSSEITAAKEHIETLKEIIGERKVLIIFDRNYASLEFIDFLEEAGIFYLIRLHSTNYKSEVSQMQSNDEELEILHNRVRMEHLRRSMPEREKVLSKKASTSARVLKSIYDNGESGILITNVREGSTEEINRLYRRRWCIEQKYHTLKNKVRFESVTGKASIYVPQDFWAQMLVFNIVQDLITQAEKRAVRSSKKKQHRYAIRINENIAIGLFKEQFIKLIMEEDENRKDALFKRLTTDMERYIVPVREKQKSSPRKWKYFNKYKSNLKPTF